MSYARAKTVPRLLLWSAVLAVAFVRPATGKPAETGKLAKLKINKCKLSDPQLNKCMMESANDYRKYGKTGLPELNVPAFDPYVIQEFDLKSFQGVSASLFGAQNSDKYKAYTRNVVIHHASEFIIHDLDLKTADAEKSEFFIDIGFPRLRIDAEYDMNFMMFNTPIKTAGPVSVNSTDTTIKATLNGKKIKRKNGTYLLFDTIDIKMGIKDYSIKIDSLFKKQPNLNEAMNETIMSQKAEMRKLAMPLIEDITGKAILGLMNKIMSSYPIEELFLME